MLENEVVEMKEKFVINNYDVGLHNLKEQIKEAKTVWMSNVTTDFMKKVSDMLSEDAEVKVVLFPGEEKIERSDIQFKEASIQIVNLVRGKEIPSMSVILDGERVFTVFEDPVKNQYAVSEMLYDECVQCFRGWFDLGWKSSKEI
jgi:CO dehydrogenase/acetyl-CoA synthase delta subunit